ncbi:vacuolar protein sorting-associated protein 26B-like isoform X1 [Hevea brasiliensis]|uniref:vacuolar protein sorting-associated protein 26B-like isoform X1 n=1 Tax=Hevea brasiliensis TaxID=3981 RepID=UPI0025CE2091|nr:vacuolar protein sorting-associated protein 26B-like isoform X1 [Hevea brasiliensis]XP_057991551.1 vacuolar protein sorting-associated protein 26B-like isoform X1 [Hevea brasiliensis]XP_057991552.1 vacuolar protein sorting-associated protein 26B-like isoform X1 [Hevea brasiliensis]
MNYLIGAFKPACNISIAFSDGKTRKQVPMKKENGHTVMVPLFQSQENIAGKISIEPLQGKKVEHNGIKVELLGQIVLETRRESPVDHRLRFLRVQICT